MCGIWMYLKGKGLKPLAEAAVKALAALEARGPEHTAFLDLCPAFLGFTRLAINGLTPLGHQPFRLEGGALVCNGEIYNHKELAERHGLSVAEGTSDCFVLLPLLQRMTPKEFCRTLDGVFAIAAYDETKIDWSAALPGWQAVRAAVLATNGREEEARRLAASINWDRLKPQERDLVRTLRAPRS